MSFYRHDSLNRWCTELSTHLCPMVIRVLRERTLTSDVEGNFSIELKSNSHKLELVHRMASRSLVKEYVNNPQLFARVRVSKIQIRTRHNVHFLRLWWTYAESLEFSFSLMENRTEIKRTTVRLFECTPTIVRRCADDSARVQSSFWNATYWF